MGTNGTAPGGTVREGKYLTFELSGGAFGVELSKVREILGTLTVKPMPKTKDGILGTISLRGQAIPVLDAGTKLNLQSTELTSESCTVIVNVQGRLLGMQVDKVTEVMHFPANKIKAPRVMNADGNYSYMTGTGKNPNETYSLLNVDSLFSAESEVGPNVETFEPYLR